MPLFSLHKGFNSINFSGELKLDTSKDSTAKQKKKKRKISQTNDETQKTDVQGIIEK